MANKAPTLQEYQAREPGHGLSRGLLISAAQLAVIAGILWVGWWSLGEVAIFLRRIAPGIPQLTNVPDWVNNQGLALLALTLIAEVCAVVWYILNQFLASPLAWARWTTLPELMLQEFMLDAEEIGPFPEDLPFYTVFATPAPLAPGLFCAPETREPFVFTMDLEPVIFYPLDTDQVQVVASTAPFAETYFYGVRVID